MEQVQQFFVNLGNTLGLPQGAISSIIAAILILIVGFFVAKLLSAVAKGLINKTGVQRKVDQGAKGKKVNVAKMVGKLVYYLVMVLVLISALDVLGIESALRPLQNLADNFFKFLPNILGAGVIAFAGYIIATLASELVAMAVGGIENLTERFGLSDSINWAKIAGQVVFIIIFIPLLIAAIDVLGLETLSKPLTGILQDVLAAIPKVLAAGFVLVVFYYIAKFISGFVSNLLEGVNVNAFAERMHLTNFIGNVSIPGVVNGLIFFFIMFSGIITAFNILEFDQLTVLLNDMFEITLQIIVGLVILAVGNVIANFAYNAVATTQDSSFLGNIAKFAVLGLFIAIALKTMGIADEIVNLAFGLTLGALAVAFALSFGLGGREAAGKQMEDFFARFRKEASSGNKHLNE